MKSTIGKHSMIVSGHETSVSLEDAFWSALKEIADGRRLSLSQLVTMIDARREHGNLSSAIRLFVLDVFRNQTLVPQSDHQGRNGQVLNNSRVLRSNQRVLRA
jgi:predicted DNA-binding ribbon-helix-helix protein